MKRIISILLVLLYTVSVSGMVVRRHYCNFRLIDTRLIGKTEGCCKIKRRKNVCERNCCLEKTEVLKVDIPHEKLDPVKTLKLFLPDAYSVPCLSLIDLPLRPASSFTRFFYPPPKIPLRVLYSVFRL